MISAAYSDAGQCFTGCQAGVWLTACEQQRTAADCSALGTMFSAAPQEFSVMGYTLLLSMIEYKTLVLRGDYAAAAEILPQIPQVPSCFVTNDQAT